MIGLLEEIELVEQLIDAFDVPQQDLRAVRQYEVQYVDAKEIVDTLQTLGILGETTGRPAKGAPAITAEEPQIAILELTNSLLPVQKQ